MKLIRRHFLLSGLFLTSLGQVGQAQDQPRQQHVGRVLDWSYHQVTLSGGLQTADLDEAKVEPRILFRLAERSLSRASARRNTRRSAPVDRSPVRDRVGVVVLEIF